MYLRYRKSLLRCLLSLSFLLLATSPIWLNSLLAVHKANAQAGGALVVTTCGALPSAFSVGSTRSFTLNTSGQICN